MGHQVAGVRGHKAAPLHYEVRGLDNVPLVGWCRSVLPNVPDWGYGVVRMFENIPQCLPARVRLEPVGFGESSHPLDRSFPAFPRREFVGNAIVLEVVNAR